MQDILELFDDIEGQTEAIGTIFQAENHALLPFMMYGERYMVEFYPFWETPYRDDIVKIVQQQTNSLPAPDACSIKFDYVGDGTAYKSEGQISFPKPNRSRNAAFKVCRLVARCVSKHHNATLTEQYFFVPMSEKHGSLYTKVADRHATELKFKRIDMGELSGEFYAYEK